MKTNISIIFTALVLTACKQDHEYENTQARAINLCMSEPSTAECAIALSPPMQEDAVEANPLPSKTKKNPDKQKKIIKDGYISIKVQQIDSSKKRIDELVKKFGAYYESEDFSNGESNAHYNLKIRIPCKNFDDFLKFSESGIGELVSKDINTRDVTEEYEDDETRLNSKRIFRDRYYDLLQKAVKVPDILSIEENIRVLQEEIESKEGHLKFLDDRILYSTLNVNLFFPKDKKEMALPGFGQKMRSSLTNGWESVIISVLWLVKQWPWLLMGFISTIFLKIILNRRKEKKKK